MSPTETEHQARHTCICQRPVPEVTAAGVMLFSSSPVVASKLASGDAEPDERGAVRLDGRNWIHRLQRFVDSLSVVERRDLLATEISPDGHADPWQAMPVEDMLARLQTAWLPHVLNQRCLEANYQPIVELQTGRPVAFEALMRAELGPERYGGGQLIEAARAHSALFQFDQQAREAAIRGGFTQLNEHESLFINFCPTVIYDPAICLQTTWRAAREVGCPLDRLVFEVIESEKFPEIEHLRHILEEYREQGARVALDDLGAGHTALSYVDLLEPDLVKLDRDLLPADAQAAGDNSLLRGFVEYAHERGITVVAEGIETAEQYDLAAEVGVDYGQGWLFGKPAATIDREPWEV